MKKTHRTAEEKKGLQSLLKNLSPSINKDFNLKTFLIGVLLAKISLKTLDENELETIKEAVEYLEEHLAEITFSGKHPAEPDSISFKLSEEENDNPEVIAKVKKYLLSPLVLLSIAEITGTIRPFLKYIAEQSLPERLHKQPRSLLKTLSRSIGNTTETPGIFTLPQGGNQERGAIEELKEEISRNTAALALLLIQKYQENNNKPLEINNLSAISEQMNCNNRRLKIYLLYLGGYVYPIRDIDPQTKELVLSNELLFKIEFRYSRQTAEKYSVNEYGEIQGVERIGTNLLSFIQDEPLDRVIITPSHRFIKALSGEGLGNILTVNDRFIGLILELSDIATKILCYSSSNQPNHKVKEENLIKHLGLTKQVKTQGRPRVRSTILKGLQELQEKGHIKNYFFQEATGIYSYTYSDKYVKFKQPKTTQKQLGEGVQ